MPIHPTAIVDPSARIDPTAEIGPFCLIGAEVEIAARTKLIGHAYFDGPLTVGEDNIFYPYCSIGATPQDLKFKGERSFTRIGNRNRVREFVTIHRGTEGGGLWTTIGDNNTLLAYVHIAHDCQVGSNCILSNAATLGGHVVVGDWAVLSGLCAVHQFCRVGKHAIIGGGSIITQDVAPYSMSVSPRDVKLFGANKVGLERRGFSAETVDALHKTFRLLGSKTLNTSQAVEKIREEFPAIEEVREVIEFIESSARGVVK